MRGHLSVGAVSGTLAVVLAAARLAPAATDDAASSGRPTGFAGTKALAIRPENNYWGYDSAIYGALAKRGFDVAWGEPDDLADPEKLKAYDLVTTSIKRRFTSPQVTGLKAYLAGGGALYASWGGPMSCPGLLEVFGVRNARSVRIKGFTVLDSLLTGGKGEQQWSFPAFAGYVGMGRDGREMVAFDFLAGTETVRDDEGRCLGTLREEGAGRCALLGFCPSNYRFVTEDAERADALLDNLLSWLLRGGSGTRSWPNTVEVCLPRSAKVYSVSVNGRRIRSEAKKRGSLTTVAVPVASVREGQTARVRVACDRVAAGRHVETWLHNPVGSWFNAFATPAQAAGFLAEVGVTVVQPLLRYDGGSICYLRGIPGDRPRGRIARYEGDFFAEYVDACHERGVKVIGGLYLDWKRFDRHLKDAPPLVGKGAEKRQKKKGERVCPLDSGVQRHNLAVVRNLLTNYPKLDGVILDDNFEFDRHPCHCGKCLGRFDAYCRRRESRPRDAAADPANKDSWKAFWKAETLAFTKRVHDVCASHGKPVGGWSGGTGTLAFRDIFDFAGDMHYTEPPSTVAALWPEAGDFDIITLLWGMSRRGADMEADVLEAIRSGSHAVGFWMSYARIEGDTDNRWSLGPRPGGRHGITPGTISAMMRAFAGAEEAWMDYYRENLVRGDARFVVTRAKLDSNNLTVEIKNLGRRADRRIVGPVDLSRLE